MLLVLFDKTTKTLSMKKSYNKKVNDTVKVWDLPTRLFHWGLVIVVSGAAFTGFIEPEWWLSLHVWFGYAVLALLLFRLVWGFAGSRYSRFSSFLYARTETLVFLGDLIRGKPSHYLGHNPAAALMVFALLATFAGIVLTGLCVLGGTENQGPFAALVPYWLGEGFEEVHEILAIVLLFLVTGHLLGVIVESLLTSENLAKSMFTGTKVVLSNDATQAVKWSTSLLGTILMAASVIVVLVSVSAFSAVPSSFPFPTPVSGTLYEEECGDCHHAFHPSLLPGSSWSKIMIELESHFGEDASLDVETVSTLNYFIAVNSAEHGYTKAANLFRTVASHDPLRITAIPVWNDIHNDISDKEFSHKSVGGQTNCEGCHRDALQGRFADKNIQLPED